MSDDMRPRFKEVDPERIRQKLLRIPVAGKTIAPQSSHSCRVCRRRIGPLGRLPALGWPTCSDIDCGLSKIADVTELFEGPYGRTVDQITLSAFALIYTMPDGRVLVRRKQVIDRAAALAQAHKELLDWQIAYDHYEWFYNPEGYEQGAQTLIPPQRIEDVLVLRPSEPPVPVEPIGRLPPDVAAELRRIKTHGPTVLQPEF